MGENFYIIFQLKKKTQVGVSTSDHILNPITLQHFYRGHIVFETEWI